MANQSIFSSLNSKSPPASVANNAGGPAYQMTAKQTLAQMCATGTFGNTFYCQGRDQLAQFKELIQQIHDDHFLAKLAVYSRQKAFMKDMPAAIVTVLASRNPELMHKVFDRVIDNGRMIRNVFQMARSGQFGKRGLSSSLQRAFKRWFNETSVNKIVNASIGNDPTLRDILRMARPKPKDNMRRALFGWLSSSDESKWAPASSNDLPESVQSLMAYRKAETAEGKALIAGNLPLRWDLLSESAKDPVVWKAIVKKMGPQALRMNLNTMMRHQVFRSAEGKPDTEMIRWVADQIGSSELVHRSRQFPYQFLAAYKNAMTELPSKIRSSLHKAAEIASGNVPEFPGPVVIGVDTSGSMTWPVTGYQGNRRASKVRCVDAAALFAAAVVRKNPDSVIVPFDTQVHKVKFDPEDTILSIADRLSQVGGGGTDCSIPIAYANKQLKKRAFQGVVIVSDNESWVYKGRRHYFGSGATGVVEEWTKFIANQKKNGVSDPKLICIDIAPNQSTQAPDRADILNVGGFSDAVFGVVDSFLRSDSNRFVSEVEAIEI